MTGFASLLLLFWLLGSYFVAVLLVYWLWFDAKDRSDVVRTVTVLEQEHAVAILYPTCDDFQREALLTCLAQNYANAKVFILDDSRNNAFRTMIDSFESEFDGKVLVVRRPDRAGFKAGNLNYALRGAAKDFPFFAVMDADERIPQDFLSALVPRLINHDFAFVQASHAPHAGQQGTFARVLGQTILPFWSVLLPLKNRFGFVPCVGHGVIVRRTAWEAVGGFPEIASEDLAFSAALLQRGERGVFANDVVCQEDFPYSMAAFRRQQERYVAGVFETFVRYLPRLLLSGKAPMLEKCDFALSCLPLYIPVLCLIFITITGVAIPLAADGGQAFFFSMQNIPHAPVARSLEHILNPLWEIKFAVLSVVFSLSPCFLMLASMVQKRTQHPWRAIVLSNMVYLSTMVSSLVALLKCLTKTSVPFHPTGQHQAAHVKGLRTIDLATGLLIMELAVMLVLVVTHYSLRNYGFAAVAAAPLVARACARNIVLFECCAAFLFCIIFFETLIDSSCGVSHSLYAPTIVSVEF